jgi:hypothetical protein
MGNIQRGPIVYCLVGPIPSPLPPRLRPGPPPDRGPRFLSEWPPTAALPCRVTGPVAVALPLRVTSRPPGTLTGSAATRRRSERLAGVSRLLTAAVSLAVSIWSKPSSGLAHREVGRLPLRRLPLGTWQRRTKSAAGAQDLRRRAVPRLSLVVHLRQLHARGPGFLDTRGPGFSIW